MIKTREKIFIVLALFVLIVSFPGMGANAISGEYQEADLIPGYLSQINSANLVNVATNLVNLYGPRRSDAYSPYLDASCTLNNSITYPKSTIEMSADYVKGLFEAMGYPSGSITMEELPGGGEHNVYVTKMGSTYPNVFIEFSGHMDSVIGSPGGADNASGSTAVIELARVLKDYPNRYSMRFILWAGEEYSVQRGAAYNGSTYHVQQALARGEQIKTGLVMDHIGWHYPSDPTGYMNEISFSGVESERIADMFNQVRTDYGIGIGYGKDQGIQNSDEHSYWNYGQTAVSSGGGWLFYRPNYHSCSDTASNINFTNVLRVAQQNLAVGLKLDAEVPGVPPTPTLTQTLVPSGSITIGENNILSADDSGNGNLLIAQQVTLSQAATIQSLSFYITNAVGQLRLGIYDDAGGRPGTLKAQTGVFTPVVGWNTKNVLVSSLLPAGTYWLAYLPESNDLHFRADHFNGSARYYSYPFGEMPGTFSSTPQNGSFHFSFYATLSTGTVASPTSVPTYTLTATLTPTHTSIPPTATYTPTNTATSIPTNTPVLPTATYTRTVTPTFTLTYTATFAPTNTPALLTATYTSTNTATFTPAFTSTHTATYTPTDTPVPPTATYPPTNTATFTATFTPTNTATFTPSPTSMPSSSDVLYLSSTTNGTVGGVAFADEDILSHNRATGIWSMYFDGSDVGITSDIDSFSLMSDGSILLSLDADVTVGALGVVDDSDIIRFMPTALGTNTAGSFQWYFDGSDVNLTTTAEDIDAIGFAPDGKLIISTGGSFSVMGVSGNDEDLLVFTPALLGSTTSGTWSLYFDGSDVGLNDATSEEINEIWIDPSNNMIFLTTLGAFTVTGVSGNGSDIFTCTPGTLGSITTCTYSSYWVGSANGFSGEIVDGLDIVR